MDTVSKAKAAAAARSNKGKKNWRTQYYLWIGGSIGSIVVACLLLVLNPDKGPFQIPVNDQGAITHINRNAKTWTAGSSSFFDGWTIGDVKTLEGVGGGGNAPDCVVSEGTVVPDSFDSRQKWPKCFNNPIYNMGNCSASWAVATASALSNRFCVSDPDTYSNLILSPQQLLSCDSNNRGCDGGDIDSAWSFLENAGLVSEICFPYQADSAVDCKSRCSSETPLKAASHCQLSGEEAVKKEIFLNGPVSAPIFLVDDFLVYRGGVYKEMATSTQLTGQDRNRIVHAVKVIGWGSEGGKKYWTIENSWGEDWGENGFARILRGGNQEKRESIIIETFMVAGTPASNKPEEDAEEDIDLEDVDLDGDEDGQEASVDLDDDEV